MPTFEVTAPDGKKLEINGPEGGTQEQALAYAKANYKSEPAKEPGIGDRIGQVGRGLAEGFASGVEFVKEGLTPRIGGMDIGAMQKAEARDVGLVEKVTGPLPEPGPKDTMGRYLRTAGQFLGNPLSYVGPGGAAAKGISAIGGALGSQTAHEAGLGPIGEAVGAVVGGSLPRTGARVAPHPSVSPSLEELKTEYKTLFNDPRVAEVEIKPAAASQGADDIYAALRKERVRPKPAAETKEILDEYMKAEGKNFTMEDFQSMREELGELAGEVNIMGKPTREARAATIAIKQVDDWLPKLQQGQLAKGDAAAAASLLEEARGNASAAFKAERLATGEERAEDRASISHSGTNTINNLKRQALRIKETPHLRRGLTEEQKGLLQDIIDGNTTGNIARRVSKMFGEAGLGGFLGAAGGFALGGPAAAPVVPAIGFASRKIGEISTRRQFQKLDESLRGNSPLGRKMPKDPNKFLEYLRSLPPEWQQILRTLGTQTTRPQ